MSNDRRSDICAVDDYSTVDTHVGTKDFAAADRAIATYRSNLSMAEADLKKSQEGYEYFLSEIQTIVDHTIRRY